jgi:hypothetical protein
MNTETTNVQFLNQSFIDKIDQGLVKEAGAAMSAFVRQKLRETGFTRKILTPQMITASDLDRGLDDQPRVIIEKEPDSVAAFMSLSGQPTVRYFKGSRYEVPFYKIQSERFVKSKFELATYRTDIRNILQENSVKDLQKQEDVNFFAGLRAIQKETRGAEFVTTTGDRITDRVMNLIQTLVKDHQKPGKILLSHSLYLQMLREPATQLGDAVASKHFETGSMDGFYGFEIVTTIKGDILSSEEGQNLGDLVAIFAPEEYLGQFYSLQEPTVFLEAKADMIEFQTYESIGIGIGNTKGFVIGKVDLA